jgi:hypothetical protein
MKNIFTKVLVVTAIVAASLVPAAAFAAGNASFSFSTSNTSVLNGGSINVSVYENGDNVNVVTTKFSYDAGKLRFDGMNCGAAFSMKIAETGGATCSVAPGSPAVSGSQFVGTASFTALVGSGSSNISLNSSSKIASNGTNIWNQVSPAAVISFTTPVSTPPSSNPNPNTGDGSGNNGSNPSQSSSTNKTASSAANTSKDQSSTSDQSKDAATNSDTKSSADKKSTDTANETTTEKNAGYNPTLAIALAVLAVLAGVAFYASRNPKKVAAVAAMASAAWLTVAPKKKSAVKPVAKKTPAKKAKAVSKTTKTTKSKKASTKKPTKKS